MNLANRTASVRDVEAEPNVLKTVPVGPLSVLTVTTRDCGVPAPL
jgi:hypothetical protein